MEVINDLLIVFFSLAVGTTFYRDHLIRTKVGFRQASDAVYLAKKANGAANSAIAIWFIIYLGCWAGTAWLGWEETKWVANTLVSLLIATSIIQDGRKNLFWRGLGYGFFILLVVTMLSGCTKDAPRDTVVPSGAVTVNVPVPTCGDDLAKTLFKGPVRPETLPINLLTEADKKDYDKVYRAYIDTVEILTKYAVAQERDRAQAQQQCVAIRNQVGSLNTKTPVIPVQK